MAKKIISMLMVAVLCVGLSGCLGSKDAQTFAYDIASEPKNLDPQVAHDNESLLVIKNIFEGLLAVQPDGTVGAAAAQNYEVSEDGLRYTFYLDPAGKWSDGTQVTADDFVYAFRRIFDPATTSPGAQTLDCIQNAPEVLAGTRPGDALGVEAADTLTLVITLSYSNPLFPELLASTEAMPCNRKFFEETGGKYGLEKDYLLVNGPFVLTKWVHDDYLVLRKNEHYRGAKEMSAERVTLYIPDDEEDSAVKRFLDEKTNLAMLTGEEIQSVAGKGYNVDTFENTVWVLLLNTEKPVLQNAQIRKAFAMAFDRSSYGPYMPDWLTPAYGVVPPAVHIGGKSYRTLAGEVSGPAFDPVQAKTEFQTALRSMNLDDLPATTLLCPEEGPHAMLVGYTQQIWQRELQAFLSVESLPLAELTKRVEQRDFDVAVVPLTVSYNSPAAVLGMFASDAQKNYAGYQNTGFDSRLSGAAEARNAQSMADSYAQAERLLLADGAVIPMYYESTFYARGKKVSGILLSPFSGGIYFKNAKIQK